MPSTKTMLIQRYELTKNRNEQERSQNKEGEDEVVDECEGGGGAEVDPDE